MISRLALSILVFGSVMIAPVWPAQTGVITIVPSKVGWQPGPSDFPPGMKQAILEGDSTKTGSSYALRFWMPAGYVIKPHKHPDDEEITVISGSLLLGIGKTIDAKAMRSLPAGSYFWIPRGTYHYLKTKSGTVIEQHGIGPLGNTIYADASGTR